MTVSWSVLYIALECTDVSNHAATTCLVQVQHVAQACVHACMKAVKQLMIVGHADVYRYVGGGALVSS